MLRKLEREKLIIILFKSLTDKRVKDINYFTKIINVFSFEFNKSKKGFELLFFLLSEKKCFDENMFNSKQEYKNIYFDPKVNNYNYTIKTLAYFNKKDNKKQYNICMNNFKGYELLFQCINFPIDINIAIYLSFRLWLNYLIDTDSKSGYCFIKNTWVSENDKYKSKADQYLTNNVKKTLLKFKAKKIKELLELKDHMESSKLKDVLKETNTKKKDELDELILKITILENKISVDKSIKPIINRFWILHEKLNTCNYNIIAFNKNPNLTTTPTGTIEVNKSKKICFFRETLPEDYSIKIIPAIFDNKLHWSHSSVINFIGWLSKIHQNDHETIHWYLKYVSSFLKNGNDEKIILINCGETGNNSKTALHRLYNYTYGNELSCKLSASALTNPYASSSSPRKSVV